MLCGNTPSCCIMSTFQTCLALSPAWTGLMSKQRVSQRLVVYQSRLFSISGLEQTPMYGQSLTRPAASLGLRLFQRNLPVFSSNASSTPASLVNDLSYITSLLEPTKHIPLATVTFP